MSEEITFTKENLDDYLKKLAKEFRKMNGAKMPAELTLIGGAAVLANYGFRENTYDIDAIIRASSSMKDAINKVGDELNLPNGWLNSDFTKTSSYTPKIEQYSKYYKTFSNVLTIRTVSAEYLVAMKLMSGRQYKNDLSDVVGVILEQKNQDKEIKLDDIKRAATELYGDYTKIPEESRIFIENVYKTPNLEQFFNKIKQNEKENKEILLDFQEDYPDVLTEDNLQNILSVAKSKKKAYSIDETGTLSIKDNINVLSPDILNFTESECEKIKYADINENINDITNSTFANCKNLSEIDISKELLANIDIDSVFNGTKIDIEKLHEIADNYREEHAQSVQDIDNIENDATEDEDHDDL